MLSVSPQAAHEVLYTNVKTGRGLGDEACSELGRALQPLNEVENHDDQFQNTSILNLCFSIESCRPM